MEAELIKRFEKAFKPVDRRVKEEEIILFLDKQQPQKFDRETFGELKARVDDRGQDFTPLNFASTYYQAYQLLETKKERAFMDMNNIDRIIHHLKSDRSRGFAKVVLSTVILENTSDSSNFLTFEHSADFVTNVYDFSSDLPHFLVIPEPQGQERIPLRVTLKSPQGKTLDSKNVAVSAIDPEANRVKFSDGSVLSMTTSKVSANLSDLQTELEYAKADTATYEQFAREKHSYLARTFPDVFGGATTLKPKALKLSFFLATSLALSFVVSLISLYLNFTRCMFIDVFVTMSFFANAYVWRYFNMFLAVKLIIVLVVSILLDIYWEIHKAMTFNAKYEATVKVERIKGLILTGLLILLKLALALSYYKLSREDQSDTFLGLNQDMSVNEVAPEDYLMNPLGPPDKVLP
jgi:uncharacterized membrane protein YecN with MAPEG domain